MGRDTSSPALASARRVCGSAGAGTTLRRRGGGAHGREAVVRHVPPRGAGRGEDAAARRRLRLPGGRPPAGRQARAGAAQPLRPDRATHALVVRFLYRHEQLERLVEGEPDVLIENGKIRFDRLKTELITLPELESAAHKQGFASLDEVDRAVLEPGGTVSFFGKKPGPEALRHAELTRRLDQIVSELAALRLGLARPS